MSTWTEDDKQIAARALKTLEQARVASRGAAIYCLEPVRGEMASKRPDDIRGHPMLRSSFSAFDPSAT
jgi:hypothetical protein